jgi:phage-related protein
MGGSIPQRDARSIENSLQKRTKIGTLTVVKPTLEVHFFSTDSGAEPVREWLKALSPDDRRVIGEDIKTVQLGWPLGMPLVRHMGDGIWEIRVRLENRIARVLFMLEGAIIVLLHGYIKKQQATPKPDLNLARSRYKQIRERT